MPVVANHVLLRGGNGRRGDYRDAKTRTCWHCRFKFCRNKLSCLKGDDVSEMNEDDKRELFLASIAHACEQHPEWAAFVGQAASAGISRANRALKALAADMETVASAILAMKLDGHTKRLCYELLERNKDKCSVNFQFYIDRLKQPTESDGAT